MTLEKRGGFWFLILSFLLWLVPTSKAQESAISLSRRLPRNTAVVISIPDSGKRFQSLISGLNLSDDQVDEFFDLWLHTDVLDGTEFRPVARQDVGEVDHDNVASDRSGYAQFLSKTRSIHLVMHSCRAGVGDWVFLIEQPDDADRVVGEVWLAYSRLWLRLFARLGAGDSYHARGWITPGLANALWKWEDSIGIIIDGKWICIGSSEDHCRQSVGLLQQDLDVSLPNSLFNERGFKSWIANAIPDAAIEIFLATGEAKGLLEGLSYVTSDESWRLLGYDATPWFGYWWQWQTRDNHFVVDQISKRAATRPLSSMLEVWPSYKELDEFPPLPPTAISLSGRHLDLEKWNEIASIVYDAQGGEGSFDKYQSDVITAFRNGSLRPKLGHVQFEYAVKPDSSNLSTNVSVFKIEPDATPELIEAHLANYYQAMEEVAKQAFFQTNYQRRIIGGNVAWWTDTYTLHPVYKRLLLENGRQASHLEEYESATGSIIFGNYVISGKEDAVKEVVEWNSPGQLTINGTDEYVSELKNMANRVDLPGIHSFDVKFSALLEVLLRMEANKLRKVMPIAAISKETRDRAKIDYEFLSQLSRPERLAILLDNFLDSCVEREPRRYEIMGLDKQQTRSTTVISWQFDE